MSRRLLSLAAFTVAAALASSSSTPMLVRVDRHGSKIDEVPYRPTDASTRGLKDRPELINYNPVAAPGAVVIDSTNTARFTVLTDRLIRMEQVGPSKSFEDRATIAMMNRNLPVPTFTQNVNNGVLTISTSQIKLTYTVGQPFSSSSLSVTSLNPNSAFTSWSFGDPFPGNLLGTIRGLDGQVSIQKLTYYSITG